MGKDEVKTIADLKFDPKNARKRTERSSHIIRTSLEKFGGMRSIVLDENNVIRAGNGTVEEAGQIGIERIKIIEADGNELIAVRRSGLTEEQWKEYAVVDNRASELSEWDTEVLAELDQEIDLSTWFSDKEFNQLIDNLETESNTGFQSEVEPETEEVEEARSPVDGQRYPLAIVLTYSEFQEWKIIKEALGEKQDTKAFLKLMRGET